MNVQTALVITAMKWKQFKSLSTDTWINKLWYDQAMNFI